MTITMLDSARVMICQHSIQMSAIRLNSNVHFDLSFSLLVDFLPSETTGGLMPCSDTS